MIAYILDKKDLSIKDILDFDTYTFKFDIDYNDKSSLTFIRQPNLEDGDVVICKKENAIVFLGLAEKIKSESGDTSYSISLLQIENLFNRFIFLEKEGLIDTAGIEYFINQTIKDNFTLSGDRSTDMRWLHTFIDTHMLNVSKPDVEQGVYNLKTYLGNLKQHYGVFTDFEIKKGSVIVHISKKELSELLIDIEVSDVSNYVENYEVSILSKLIVKWKQSEESTEEVKKSFYLLSDRSISEDMNALDRVDGTIKCVQITTEKEEDMRKQVFNEFSSNRYNHKISFNIIKNSKLYPENEFFVGRPCTVKTKSGVKKSMITKLETSDDSGLLKVTLGNMKVTLTDKLRR